MRTSELNQLIALPEQLQKDQINDLQDLISEYPYFTSAQLLLTKAFFDSENLNFEKQLRLSAAYAGDRKKLHDLLYLGKKTGDEVSESTEVQSADSQIRDVQITDSQSSEIEEEAISDLQSPISESEPRELDEKAQAEQDFLDAQIISAAIGNSIVDELETGVEDPEPGNQNLETGIIDQNDRAQTPPADPSEAPAESFDDTQPHSFSDWLKHFSGHKNVGPEPRTADSPIGEASAEPNPVIQSISKQVKEIQEKAEFYSAAKMAKLSVTESDDLVTETLAKVFEDQGKFDKAIKAYEKLRLKFPEKSVYFAGRIKAVEKKLKS